MPALTCINYVADDFSLDFLKGKERKKGKKNSQRAPKDVWGHVDCHSFSSLNLSRLMQASKCQTQHGGHRKGRLDTDKWLPREKSTVSTTKHPSLQTNLIAKVSLQVRHLSLTFTKRSRPFTVLLTLHPMSSASPIISSQARGQYTVTWATYNIYWLLRITGYTRNPLMSSMAAKVSWEITSSRWLFPMLSQTHSNESVDCTMVVI